MANGSDINVAGLWRVGLLYKAIAWFIRFAMWITKGKVAEIYYSGWPLPTISEYIADAEDVWFVVHTGMRLDATNIIYDPNLRTKIKTIIFPCTKHNPAIGMYAVVANEDEKKLKTIIEDLSRKAHGDIKIIWTDSAICESMIICNPPTKENIDRLGTALVDVYLPHLGTENRFKIKITRRNHARAFADIIRSFEKICENGHPPILD